MDYKILQIIPNTKKIKVEYQGKEGSTYSEIVCFALIEWSDGSQAVRPMDICADGELDFPSTFRNFIGIISE